jgi:hypothetical protein
LVFQEKNKSPIVFTKKTIGNSFFKRMKSKN